MRKPGVFVAAILLLSIGIVLSLIGITLVLWDREDDLPDTELTRTYSYPDPTQEARYNATLTELAIFELTAEQAFQTPPPAAGQMVVYLATPEGGPGPVGPIGCGNYLVPVTRGEIPPTETHRQIAYALTDLFSIRDQFYGQSGLYNVLYQSNLVVDTVNLDGSGHADIYLTGAYLLGGVCDNPLFQAQIEYTALQFSSVSSVSVFINGTAIEDVLSGRGT